MTEDYIILRAPADPESLPPDARPADMSGGPAIKAEAAQLTRKEADDAQNDPEVVAVAPSITLKLIEPVSAESDNDEADASAAAAKVTWGVKAVGAHESDYDGAGITVACLDTGIDPDHPAFAGMDMVRKNFTLGDDDDVHGHGTHCAGTICGQAVNGLRIGVAPGVDRLLVGKVLGKGGGSSAKIVEAIQWAVEQGAHVISMSLGIDFPGWVQRRIDGGMPANVATSQALQDYRKNIELFTTLTSFVNASSKTILIGASGNESSRKKTGSGGYVIDVAPPAAGGGIIAVGAMAHKNGKYSIANFSNSGVDLVGPGVRVKSARVGGGLTNKNGTSMATPHVAGVAALWAQSIMEDDGEVSVSILRNRLIGTASRKYIEASSKKRADVGSGMVQAPR